jgi:SAM-dependent methyltransferase
MSTDQAGSYAFGQFQHNEAELERLKTQAAAAQALERMILTQAGLKPGMRVLDLACGPGIVSCLLADMAAPGRVLGLDLSAELLVEARAAAGRQGLTNLGFQQGNAYGLELEDEQFDFIYARFLFQHLEHPLKALAEARRVLKPGGILAIADVDDGWLCLYPEPVAFKGFTQRAAELQAKSGGDRLVGRKLGTYLGEAGFEQRGVRVATVTSADLGMKGLLDLTTGYKFQQLVVANEARTSQEMADIYSILNNPLAWGFAGIFVATGVKTSPDSG